MTTSVTLPAPAVTRPWLTFAALMSMMMMAFVLVTSEFLPNGMLLEMATGLAITEGQAGQTVTATALVGAIVAPTVGLIFPRVDRRSLLVWAAVAGAASNIAVALAPNFALLLIARFLLGAALASFWAMSIAVAARIAGPERLGRAVMFNSAGVSLATVAGVPIGVALAELFDWRAVFTVVGLTTAAVAVALRAFLPSVPPAPASRIAILLDTIRQPGIGIGLLGHVLVVGGHMLGYTYVRVALERMPNTSTELVILLLTLFGIGGLVGNIVVGLVIDRAFVFFAVSGPLAIAAMTLAVIVLPGSVGAVATAIFIWGFFFASWLIIVNTWVGRRMPDRLEAGGGLVVVGFQVGITVAAAAGGIIVDSLGVVVVYTVAAITLTLGAVLFGLASRSPAARTPS